MPEATVVVTTKDRRDDLRRCLQLVLAQSAECEVLVVDDGSSDGTAQMVTAEFPTVRVDRSERSLGLIAQRNRAARLVTTPLIVSIDDDAELVSSETIADAIAEFDHPRIGVVAIPFIDIRHGPEVRQRAPEGGHRYVADTYVGTAHALRRDVFLAVGGYRDEFFRQHEEVDFSLRMLDAGYVVRLGSADPLHHLESPKRDVRAAFVNERRNLVLHAWHNVPMPYLMARLAQITLHAVPLARRYGQGRYMAEGLWMGLRDCLTGRVERRPVARATHRLDHLLRKRGPLVLKDIEDRLPPMAATEPAVPPSRAAVA